MHSAHGAFWQERNGPQTRQIAEPLSEQMKLGIDVIQYFFRPFVLSFALALRITKVTIEVFEWTK
jgi:hypothetical protein